MARMIYGQQEKNRAVINSDEEDNSSPKKQKKKSQFHESGKTTQTDFAKKLQTMNQQLNENNILVSPEETTKLSKENSYVKNLKTHMEASLTESQKKLSGKRSQHVKTTVSNSVRIMTYLAPGYNILDFTWSCLADADKLKQFFIILGDVGMATRTISNYQKALNKLFDVALADVDFRLTQPGVFAHVNAISVSFKELKRGINKTINEQTMEKKNN